MKNDLPLRFHSAKLTQKLSNSKFFSCIISAVSSVTLTANGCSYAQLGRIRKDTCDFLFFSIVIFCLTNNKPLIARSCCYAAAFFLSVFFFCFSGSFIACIHVQLSSDLIVVLILFELSITIFVK